MKQGECQGSGCPTFIGGICENRVIDLTERGNNVVYQVQKGGEYEQHPNHPDYIEKEVKPCSSLGMYVPDNGRDVGRNRGANIFTEYHRRCNREGNPALHQHHQRDGRGRRTTLGEQCEYGTHEDKEQGRKNSEICVAVEEGEHFGIIRNIGNGVFDEIQTDEQNTEANHGFRHITQLDIADK